MKITDNKIQIITFKEEFFDDFGLLNFEWLDKFFYIEDYDREVLTNPKKYILNDGGQILFALSEGKAVGTVALIKRGEGDFELSKMGVTEKFQGNKIGLQLMNASIKYAKENKWNRLFLDSSRKLTPALNMYKKVGFNEIPVPKDTPYERCDIRMELILQHE